MSLLCFHCVYIFIVLCFYVVLQQKEFLLSENKNLNWNELSNDCARHLRTIPDFFVVVVIVVASYFSPFSVNPIICTVFYTAANCSAVSFGHLRHFRKFLDSLHLTSKLSYHQWQGCFQCRSHSTCNNNGHNFAINKSRRGLLCDGSWKSLQVDFHTDLWNSVVL